VNETEFYADLFHIVLQQCELSVCSAFSVASRRDARSAAVTELPAVC
jgi:hypothetical protein